MNRGLWLLAGAAAGAVVLSQAFRSMKRRLDAPQNVDATDPSIPPSESSATRFRDKPGYGQDDADQEPL